MCVPLTRRERWIDRVLLWSDGLLLVLAFLLAWFLIATPAATKAWPIATQLLHRIVTCTGIVGGILTLRWQRPVGFIVTFLGYGLLAASQVFSSGVMLLAFAGLLMIAGIFIAEAMSRLGLRGERTDR